MRGNMGKYRKPDQPKTETIQPYKSGISPLSLMRRGLQPIHWHLLEQDPLVKNNRPGACRSGPLGRRRRLALLVTPPHRCKVSWVLGWEALPDSCPEDEM